MKMSGVIRGQNCHKKDITITFKGTVLHGQYMASICINHLIRKSSFDAGTFSRGGCRLRFKKKTGGRLSPFYLFVS